MFKKLFNTISKMPPQAKMLLSIAGFGTAAGTVYALKAFFFPNTPMQYLVIGVLVAAVVVYGIVAGLMWLFGRSASRRQSKMAAELTEGGASGPTSMDVRAAIKANNEKFNAAVAAMKKDTGASVYDLPWYIVIGDSGCGKTKLITESGLAFSMGRPEGYQLGTVNYNWWFTEDAVFIDMAGRLCNPQDDADHREWQGVLDTIARGRKGFPINGAAVCVSAEHLLQDSPEKHEADANTALERLRELQSKLGVTFATYLIVTKCDKILGFMQYFDRAERDITIKNQIFGWSRPGAFNELYDPEHFGDDFDAVYKRLNELRLRRLNDEADESELGMAYAFPEEFRELRAPLQTYVRTLFPMIKNPRGLKNLIFRGAYFTSATQQGGVILKHLSERLGAAAAENFPPLESMYPRPRPHFAKEIWTRKVFPEFGLVFRNEDQVVRNKKLSKLLKVGSIVLGAALFGMMGLGMWKFYGHVGQPRADATAAKDVSTPGKALEHAGLLNADARQLSGELGWARLILLVGDRDEPVRKLGEIRDGLFEKHVLPVALEQVGQSLREGTTLTTGGKRDVMITAELENGAGQIFRDALATYVGWYAAKNEKTFPASLSLDDKKSATKFMRMCGVVTVDDSPVKNAGFADLAGSYFSSLTEGRNPATLLDGPKMQAADTIQRGVANLHRYLSAYATLDDKNPDAAVGEWMRIRVKCEDARSAYSELLAMSGASIKTMEEFDAARQKFIDLCKRVEGDLAEAKWSAKSSAPGTLRIPSLRELILAMRKTRWADYADRVKGSYSAAEGGDDPVAAALISLKDTPANNPIRRGLDLMLWESLKSARMLKNPDTTSPTFDPASFEKLFIDLPEVYEQNMVVLAKGSDQFTPDAVNLSAPAQAVLNYIKPLREAMERVPDAKGQSSGEANIDAWLAVLCPDTNDEGSPTSAPAGLSDFWKPAEALALANAVHDWIQRGGGTRVLRQIAAKMNEAAEVPWGVATLAGNYADAKFSYFSIPIPDRSAAVPKKSATAQPEPSKPSKKSGRLSFSNAGSGSAAPVVTSPADATGGTQVPACATADFYQECSMGLANLIRCVNDLGAERYLAEAGEGGTLRDQTLDSLRRAGQRYANDYASAWSRTYGGSKVPELERLTADPCDWSTVAGRVADNTPGGARARAASQVQQAMATVLKVTRWARSNDGVDWSRLGDVGQFVDANVGGLFVRGFETQWDAGNGQFWRRANYGAGGRDSAGRFPWDGLAADFVSAWSDVAGAMASNQMLPASFTADMDNKPRPPIPWKKLADLNEQFGLTDELTARKVMAFTKRSQEMLSARLTEILHGIEKAHFRDDKPYDGWPYLDSLNDPMLTVKFESFKAFLREMETATKVLGPLEEGLPETTPGWRERRTFYESCRQWTQFIRPNDVGNATPMVVTTWVGDPKAIGLPPSIKLQPQKDGVNTDTPQLYFGSAYLNLGLKRKGGGDSTSPALDPQSIPTETDMDKLKDRPGEWTWSNQSEMTQLKLMQPRDKVTDAHKELGNTSALGLCAYLHRYGVENAGPYEGKWVVPHEFPRMEFNNGPRVLSVMLVFQLERPLPRPIAPLKPLSLSGSGGTDKRS